MENFISNTADEAISSEVESQITIEWTQFSDVFAKSKKSHQMGWQELIDYLSNAPTYPSKGAMPLLKLASFGDVKTDKGSLRNDDNVIEVYGVEGDYDAGSVSIEEAASRLAKRGIEAFLYSSPSATPELHKWRVLAPFKASKEPEERHHFMGLLNAALGGILAPESFTLSQSYYYGTTRNGVREHRHIVGETIDLKTGQWEPEFKKNVVEVKNDAGEVVGERLNIEQLSNNITNGLDIHNSTRDLAAHLAATGVRRSTALAMLQGLMSANSVKDARWDERYQDLGNLVTSAYLKFSNGEFVLDANGAVVQANYWKQHERPLSNELEAYDWVVDNFLAVSILAVAGQPGAGKTTLFAAFATLVAGLTKVPHLPVEYWRKVIYVTEDPEQLKRLFFAIAKWEKIPIEQIQERITLIEARRVPAEIAAQLDCYIGTHSVIHKGVSTPPLFIIDTVSATFDLDDENSNSETAKFLSKIKTKIFAKGSPIILNGHTSKVFSTRTDAMVYAMRGASSMAGDATATGVIFREDGINNTAFFVIGKKRFQSYYNEIQSQSQVHSAKVRNKYGDEVSIEYRLPWLNISSEAERIALKEENKTKFSHQELLDLKEQMAKLVEAKLADAAERNANLAEGENPKKVDSHLTATEIRPLLKGDTNARGSILDKLVADKVLEEYPIPKADAAHHNRVIGYKFIMNLN